MKPIDMQDILGLEEEKYALLVAAAGRHNILLIGPPGAGKTMLARRLLTILPPPLPDEAAEIEAVYTAAGLDGPPAGQRPFRTVSVPVRFHLRARAFCSWMNFPSSALPFFGSQDGLWSTGKRGRPPSGAGTSGSRLGPSTWWPP